MPNQSPICVVHPEINEDVTREIRIYVCKDLPTYHHEDKYYCPFHLPNEWKVNNTNFLEEINKRIKADDNDFRYIYVPNTGAFFNKFFTANANFDSATFSCLANFSNITFDFWMSFKNVSFLEEAIFDGAKFNGGVDFNGAKFNKESSFRFVSFDDVKFCDAKFTQSVDFLKAIFKTSDFSSAKFVGNTTFFNVLFENLATFNNAKFEGDISFLRARFREQAHFYSATFLQKIDFSYVTFRDNVFFNNSKFEANSKLFLKKVIFDKAVCSLYEAEISGYIHFIGGERAKIVNGKAIIDEKTKRKEGEKTGFIGKESHLDLQNAYIEKPERISFQRIRLQPSWFINVDCKKFIFSDCSWIDSDYELVNLKSEFESLENRGVIDRRYLLMRSCWQLADNCEEMKHFNNASIFRFIALESIRTFYYKGFKIWSLHWWYFISSFYGESPMWASIILLSILFIFALIFTGVDFQVCPIDRPITLSIQQNSCITRPLEFWEAIRHSLATAAFQNIEYRKPVTGWGETWSILEKILAPLQAALLALAIRRKFMR